MNIIGRMAAPARRRDKVLGEQARCRDWRDDGRAWQPDDSGPQDAHEAGESIAATVGGAREAGRGGEVGNRTLAAIEDEKERLIEM